MRYDRDGYAVECQLERGVKPPSWYFDEPELAPRHDFYIREFWDLSTERLVSMGAIPVSKIEERAERHGFDSAMMWIYKTLIRSLDGRFQKWVEGEREKARRSGKSGRSTTSSKQRRRRR